MEGIEQRLTTSGPKPAAHPQPTRPTESSSKRSELPAGLVVTATFAKEHGISESGTKKALASGRIPRAPGGLWKVGRVWVKDMLDQEGRRAFLEAYHSSEHFHHCTDPACLCHQYTAGDNAATHAHASASRAHRGSYTALVKQCSLDPLVAQQEKKCSLLFSVML
jgi:hypothetical protein